MRGKVQIPGAKHPTTGKDAVAVFFALLCLLSGTRSGHQLGSLLHVQGEQDAAPCKRILLCNRSTEVVHGALVCDRWSWSGGRENNHSRVKHRARERQKEMWETFCSVVNSVFVLSPLRSFFLCMYFSVVFFSFLTLYLPSFL